MNILTLSFKAARKILTQARGVVYTPLAQVIFTLNGVTYGEGLRVRGMMKVFVTRRGVVTIGRSLRVNSGDKYNIIGRQQKTTFWVEGELTIKDNARMSSCAIICNHRVTIGNNVVIGGNTVIYDTNFHSLDPIERSDPQLDRVKAKWAPVTIGDDVFIGAHSTILKGVAIGDGSVVGACSVVTRDIPSNEIWAGNPAVFIRRLGSSSDKHVQQRGKL